MRVKGRFVSDGDGARFNKLKNIRRRSTGRPTAVDDSQATADCRHSDSAGRFQFGGRRIVELDYIIDQLSRGCWFCGSNLKVPSLYFIIGYG